MAIEKIVSLFAYLSPRSLQHKGHGKTREPFSNTMKNENLAHPEALATIHPKTQQFPAKDGSLPQEVLEYSYGT